MSLKNKYDLVIDGRNLYPPNRGISTFIINLIKYNHILKKSNVLIMVSKFSVQVAIENNLDFKIVNDYPIISDFQISLFSFSNSIKTFFSPSNIHPIFPFRSKFKLLMVHDVSFYYPQKVFGKRNLRQLAGALLRRNLVPISVKQSYELITVSKFARDEILKYVSVSKEKKINIIYHGFEINKKKFINSENHHITFIAILGEAAQKNARNLLLAFMHLNKSFKFKLILIGVTKEYLIRNNLYLNEKWLEVRGKLENKDTIKEIQKSDCLIMPSFFESFGMPVVEALINKKPVLCSNNGALPEISHNFTQLFNPYCVDSITDAIRFFINNKEKCISDTERWNVRYKKLFNHSNFQKKYNNIFFQNHSHTLLNDS